MTPVTGPGPDEQQLDAQRDVSRGERRGALSQWQGVVQTPGFEASVGLQRQRVDAIRMGRQHGIQRLDRFLVALARCEDERQIESEVGLLGRQPDGISRMTLRTFSVATGTQHFRVIGMKKRDLGRQRHRTGEQPSRFVIARTLMADQPKELQRFDGIRVQAQASAQALLGFIAATGLNEQRYVAQIRFVGTACPFAR